MRIRWASRSALVPVLLLTLIVVFWLSTTRDAVVAASGPAAAALPIDDDDLLGRALVQLARNMSARVESAERALLVLRRRQDRLQHGRYMQMAGLGERPDKQLPRPGSSIAVWNPEVKASPPFKATRPTVGDNVMIRDTANTRKFMEEQVGKMHVITRDANDKQPYRVEGFSAWLYDADVEIKLGQEASAKEDTAEEEELVQTETDDKYSTLSEKEREAQQNVMIGYTNGSKTFRRYRPDFKCGAMVPLLPDDQEVECKPSGLEVGGAACCSPMGWCGRSPAHCDCDGCINHHNAIPRKAAKVKKIKKKQACVVVSANLGVDIKDSKECAEIMVTRWQCSNMFIMSKLYPEWGCRCCEQGTPPQFETNVNWDTFQVEVVLANVTTSPPPSSTTASI